MHTVVRLGAKIRRLWGRKPSPISCGIDVTLVCSALLIAGYLTTRVAMIKHIRNALEKKAQEMFTIPYKYLNRILATGKGSRLSLVVLEP
jgi:hypothetical protein